MKRCPKQIQGGLGGQYIKQPAVGQLKEIKKREGKGGQEYGYDYDVLIEISNA